MEVAIDEAEVRKPDQVSGLARTVARVTEEFGGCSVILGCARHLPAEVTLGGPMLQELGPDCCGRVGCSLQCLAVELGRLTVGAQGGRSGGRQRCQLEHGGVVAGGLSMANLSGVVGSALLAKLPQDHPVQ